MNSGRRKPFYERSLQVVTRSRRWRAGSRRNKREKSVGSFSSDRQVRQFDMDSIEDEGLIKLDVLKEK